MFGGTANLGRMVSGWRAGEGLVASPSGQVFGIKADGLPVLNGTTATLPPNGQRGVRFNGGTEYRLAVPALIAKDGTTTQKTRGWSHYVCFTPSTIATGFYPGIFHQSGFYSINVDGSGAVGIFSGTQTVMVAPAGTVVAGQRTSLAATIREDGSAAVYKNGVLVGSAAPGTYSAATSVCADIGIGWQFNGLLYASYSFDSEHPDGRLQAMSAGLLADMGP